MAYINSIIIIIILTPSHHNAVGSRREGLKKRWTTAGHTGPENV